MIAALVLLLTPLQAQDDLSRRIKQLSSDSVDEREEAVQALEAAGLDAIPLLEREAARTGDPEVRERVRVLLGSIPRIAALRKVFGPTKRVTVSFQGAPLGEVAKKLGASLDETLKLESLDPARPVTLDLKNATMWESLDRLARAIEGRYEYRKEGVVYYAGASSAFPVRYYEQFRISIVEIKRIDYRAQDQSAEIALVVPEIQYQRNVSPAGDKYGGSFTSIVQIKQIQDEKGADARTSRPWGPGSLSSRRPFGLQQFFHAKGEARSLTIEGTATARFSRKDATVVLPLEGDAREGSLGEAAFKVTGVTAGPTRTTVSIDGKVPPAAGMPDPPDRVKRIWLEGAEGQRLEGGRDHGFHARDSFQQDYEFKPPSFKPVRVVFEWVAEIHALDIPFRLEGIVVPR